MTPEGMVEGPKKTKEDYEREWPDERQPILPRFEVGARLLISDFIEENWARCFEQVCISHMALNYRVWCLESDLYEIALASRLSTPPSPREALEAACWRTYEAHRAAQPSWLAAMVTEISRRESAAGRAWREEWERNLRAISDEAKAAYETALANLAAFDTQRPAKGEG